MSEVAALERGNQFLPYFLVIAVAAVIIGAAKEILMNEDIMSALNSETAATGTEAGEVDDPNNWDTEHCIGGGEHDMVDAGLFDSNGHSRMRRACTKCPYSYLL